MEREIVILLNGASIVVLTQDEGHNESTGGVRKSVRYIDAMQSVLKRVGHTDDTYYSAKASEKISIMSIPT